MKSLKHILLITLSLLTACSSNDDTVAQFHIPLIKECKETVIDHLENPMWSTYAITWEIIEFNNVLATMHAPQLIGTLIVSSQSATEEEVEGVLNGALFKCYPTTNMLLTKSDLGKTILAQLDHTDRVDSPEKYYFVLDGKELSIFYLDNNHRSQN